ncbi:MAG: hypothetical protein L3J74_14745 [Bacteroidales bacterium]|nr:hypothetical protein [Bacteroidales bacterium]
MRFKYLIILLFLASALNVFSQNKSNPSFQNHKQTEPDVCVVQAKIVKIIPARKKISKQSCKQAPCFATIEIIKVEKTGRTFPEKFMKGQKIKVKFSCSLNKVENKNLPGLKKRDIFKAAIKAKPKMNTNSSEYQIQNYQKL